MKYNILDAKNQLSQLIQSALAGEEVIIANRGNPVVRLVPVKPESAVHEASPSDLNFASWLKANPLPEHLKRSHEEIETSIQSQKDSWD